MSLESACDIFERINRYGTPLGTVDIMVARTYRPKPLFNLRELLDETIANQGQNGFELDPDTILKCVSACIVRGISRKNILEIPPMDFRNKWNEAVEAINKAIDFLSLQQNIVPISRFLPNEIVIAPLSYFFLKNSQPDPQQCVQLEKFFWRVSLSQRYIEGQSTKVEEDIQTMDDIINGGSTPSLSEYDGEIPTWETIKQQEISYNSAISKTILCMLAKKQPKDFITSQDVNIRNTLAASNEKQLHHMFPRKYLESLSKQPNFKTQIKLHINSIANICTITALTNQIINAFAPSTYLPSITSNLSSLQQDDVLESHLINQSLKARLLGDEFPEFLEERSKRIVEELKKLVEN